MKPMTFSRRETLDAIRAHADKHGWPPTRAELAREFGVNVNAIECRLKAMAKKGVIELVRGTARGIKITFFG